MEIVTAPKPEDVLKADYSEEIARGVELLIFPRKVITFDEFVRKAPPYSLAIDGFVYGPTCFEPEGPRGNINHHEGGERLSMRCTAAQVHLMLKQGLADAFSENGSPKFRIYANDPDQDVSTTVALLCGHERVLGERSEPLLNRLLYAEDMLDATAGAYPFNPNSRIMRELAWIFEPYVETRTNGSLPILRGSEMALVINSIKERIDRYLLGQGCELALDTSYEDLGGGPGWKLVKETGAYARTGLFHSGSKAFVSLKGEIDGRYFYSIGKMSPWIQFPIEVLYDALNSAEGIPLNSKDRWGGSTIVGGSPRESGSKLQPEEITQVINRILAPRLSM